jgi:hypothetical protein
VARAPSLDITQNTADIPDDEPRQGIDAAVGR